MPALRLLTDHLELEPLPVTAAAALPGDREAARRIIGARLSEEWPDPGFVGVLGRHAGAPAGTEHFGIWAMIERESRTVVGDIGFHGPPDDASAIEIGYSVVPDRRERGYATEAAGAIVAWALSLSDVHRVVARCDPQNLASIRTLERAGFHRTGEKEGEIRWSRERSAQEDA